MPRAKPPRGARNRPPRPNPNVRVQPDGRGAIVDGLDGYRRAVLGQPPANFAELLKLAHELLPMAAEACGIDPRATEPPADVDRDLGRLSDTLLLASWLVRASKNDGEGENPISFIQRAKQVVEWCAPPEGPVTLLDVIERKGRELARLLGERLSSGQEFLVIACDSPGKGVDGHMTWLTSCDRRTAIELFGKAIEHIRDDQARMS